MTHHSGKYSSATTGGHVVYESRLELARLVLADLIPRCGGGVAQQSRYGVPLDVGSVPESQPVERQKLKTLNEQLAELRELNKTVLKLAAHLPDLGRDQPWDVMCGGVKPPAPFICGRSLTTGRGGEDRESPPCCLGERPAQRQAAYRSGVA